MKILLSGYHNPNFLNSMVYREKAIGYLGHELISFDDRAFLVPGRLRRGIAALEQWDLLRINERLIKTVMQTKPDVCFMIGGQRILPKTVETIKKAGVKIALWTTDAPIDFKNILAAAPYYDHLFCAGSEAADIFKAHHLPKVTWVPFGCDPHYHQMMDVTDEDQKKYGSDAVFVGSYYPNRAAVLENIADMNIAVWGPYWGKLPETSRLRSKAVEIKMNYDEWVKIFNTSKINIVIHYQDSKVPCHQASPKLFEAMACGSFVLTDQQRDVQALFKDGEELAYFTSPKDLRDKINYYLQHEDERRAIARRGYEKVRAEHTYERRFQQMLGVL